MRKSLVSILFWIVAPGLLLGTITLDELSRMNRESRAEKAFLDALEKLKRELEEVNVVLAGLIKSDNKGEKRKTVVDLKLGKILKEGEKSIDHKTLLERGKQENRKEDYWVDYVLGGLVEAGLNGGHFPREWEKYHIILPKTVWKGKGPKAPYAALFFFDGKTWNYKLLRGEERFGEDCRVLVEVTE